MIGQAEYLKNQLLMSNFKNILIKIFLLFFSKNENKKQSKRNWKNKKSK